MQSNRIYLYCAGLILSITAAVLVLNDPRKAPIQAQSQSPSQAKRSVASGYSKEVSLPKGLKDQELADFNHLSQGSDFFPYEWLLHLKSANFADKRGIGKGVLDDLDEKFRVVKDADPKQYLMGWVGMSAIWSNHDPKNSDVSIADPNYKQLVREVPIENSSDTIKSIKLVGVNCAFCHSGQINSNGRKIHVPGAPNLLNVRYFFKDLVQSTVAMFADPDLLAPFLENFNIEKKTARTLANEMSEEFFTNLAHDTNRWEIPVLSNLLGGPLTLLEAKYFQDRDRLYEGKGAIATSLKRLLKATYDFSDSDNLGELPFRMDYMAGLAIGSDPKLIETDVRYGRSDAFGRIGNLFVRGKDPVDLTGPASYPYLWGKKYQALVHNVANTNSVILRNIGESLSLGAVFFNTETLDTSVNMYNQDRLENLMYDIAVPQWDKVFPDHPADQALAAQGKPLYEKHCQGCHTAKPEKVGPAGMLYEYKMFSEAEVGTDAWAAHNVVKTVNRGSFANEMLAASLKIKMSYYDKYKVSEEERASWEQQDLRGPDFFRDTFTGYEQKNPKLNFGSIDGSKGKLYQARPLAGVWASAPFLHNGSVPSIAELLKPAKERVKKFSVYSREYDLEKMGFKSEREKVETLIFGFKVNKEWCSYDLTCFDTTQGSKEYPMNQGNSNAGHEFPKDVKLTDLEKRALMEYLKILPPEPEYAWQ